MKKLVVIFIMFFYGLSCLGASVELHYCMDRLVDYNLWPSPTSTKCGRCGMTEKKGGCCKDEHKRMSLSEDHKKSDVPEYSKSITVLKTEIKLLPHTSLAFIPQTVVTSHVPSPVPKNRLYVLNCVLLI